MDDQRPELAQAIRATVKEEEKAMLESGEFGDQFKDDLGMAADPGSF